MKLNFFPHRLPRLLAVLVVMTMIMCAMYVPVSAAGSDPTVSGLWLFHSDSYPVSSSLINVPVNFISNGTSFSYMMIGTYYLNFFNVDSDPVRVCDTTKGWLDANYRLVDFGETPQSVSAEFYAILTSFASPYVPPKPVNFLDVFSFFGSSLVSLVSSLILLFYSPETGLTFLGVLAVAPLAISVVFLFIAVISRFLKFGG